MHPAAAAATRGFVFKRRAVSLKRGNHLPWPLKQATCYPVMALCAPLLSRVGLLRSMGLGAGRTALWQASYLPAVDI